MNVWIKTRKIREFSKNFLSRHFAFYVIFIYIIFVVIVLYKTWVSSCLKLESLCREEKYNGMNPILYRIFHATKFNTFVLSRKRLHCQHKYCYSHPVSLDYEFEYKLWLCTHLRMRNVSCSDNRSATRDIIRWRKQ